MTLTSGDRVDRDRRRSRDHGRPVGPDGTGSGLPAMCQRAEHGAELDAAAVGHGEQGAHLVRAFRRGGRCQVGGACDLSDAAGEAARVPAVQHSLHLVLPVAVDGDDALVVDRLDHGDVVIGARAGAVVVEGDEVARLCFVGRVGSALRAVEVEQTRHPRVVSRDADLRQNVGLEDATPGGAGRSRIPIPEPLRPFAEV